MEDYYALLGVRSDASAKDLTKAYRVKALVLHPDKNLDNPNAGRVFAELLEAYQVLLDPKARQAYDQVIRARDAKRKRHEALDTERKRMKENLEARERAAEQDKRARQEAEAQFQAELERIRKQPPPPVEIAPAVNDMDKTIKVKWKKRLNVDKDAITSIFGTYGSVEHVVASAGSALVQFASVADAHRVMTSLDAGALKPFQCTWASGKEPDVVEQLPHTLSHRHTEHYESLTLMRMRQQQRTKMEQQLKEEEEEEAVPSTTN